MKGNRIEAKVQGGSATPYRATLVIPPYHEEQTSVLIQAIADNPLLLARLLNRELPQELMRIAEDNGIRIFPSSWQDIQLNCSCPDWAVPCKHLAAVIYIIANEIDKNPFLVFKLHAFDIAERLKELRLDMGAGEKQRVLNLADVAVAKKDLAETEADRTASERLDFSVIPDLGAQLRSLYPQKTLFFNGDFQALLDCYYKTGAKNFEKKLSLAAGREGFHRIRNSRIGLCLRPEGMPVVEYQYEGEEVQIVCLAELCVCLGETSAKHILGCSPYYSALYYVFLYCRRLLKQGALLPQLIEKDEHVYRIRWIPALINPQVKAVFDILLRIVPATFCRLEMKSKRGARIFGKYLPADENLKTLCALFLDFFFKSEEAPKLRSVPNSAVSHDAKVANLFFCPGSQSFAAFTEKEIPGSIQIWLNRFNIARKEYAPALAIDEFDKHFECNVLVENKNKPLEAPLSLREFIADEARLPQRTELIKDLAMLAEYMPELSVAISSLGKTPVCFDHLAAAGMLEKTLPALELFGIRILLPKSLQNILRPQVSIRIDKKGAKSYFSLNEMLTFDWRIALGNFLITEEEFRALSENAGKLVRIKDAYALMTESEIKRIIRSLSTARMGPLQLLQSALSEEFEGAGIEISQQARREIRRLMQEEEIKLPQGLRASLRPYQRRGFNWLYRNARAGFGSILADDMGLGKTLQVIAVLLKFKEEGLMEGRPALVAAPTTLLSNWEKEIRKFAPSLTAFVYHGAGRGRLDAGFISQTDVVLTSYGVVRMDVEKLKKIDWRAIVVDEAQNIKNSETAQAKSIKQLKGKVKIAMSGTPVENRLSEYWSIFDFSNTAYLGSLAFFNEHFGKPIEQNKDRKKLELFRKITQPFILRREKSDKSIIDDLPEKIESNQYCMLSPEQISLYKATVEKNLAQLEKAGKVERRSLVLRLLGALKQICNHPSLYLKKDDLASSLSGKTEMLFQLLDNIYESNEKALIFSQYSAMGSMLARMIYERYNKRSLFLHGGCNRRERHKMVEDFQNRPGADTFILSLKAGGTGLNLTAAAHVIHYDLWWNPAAEAQATDRAFRIGQHKNVMVYRFIAKNTLEERIDAMLQDKKELAGLAVANGESWIGNLSDADLKTLVAFE
jgi:hypothetical protein